MQPIGYYYFKLEDSVAFRHVNHFYIPATAINIPKLKPNFSNLKANKIIRMAVKNEKVIELINSNLTYKIGIELLKKSILNTYRI